MSVPLETPVETYIHKTLRNYSDPGKGKGFSRVKLEASLRNALTSETLREIADRLGTTHEVLRVWSTQPEFKHQVDANLQEFEAWFAKELKCADVGDLQFRDVPLWGKHAASKIIRVLKKQSGARPEEELLGLIAQLQKKFPKWHYPRNKTVGVMMMLTDEDDPNARLRELKEQLQERIRQRLRRVIRKSTVPEPEIDAALKSLDALFERRTA